MSNKKTYGLHNPSSRQKSSVLDVGSSGIIMCSLHDVHEMNPFWVVVSVCPHDSTREPLDGSG
jgi:hypothetical protein